MKINDILKKYKVGGQLHQQIELSFYSFNDLKGIVSGYDLYYIACNGNPVKFWCYHGDFTNAQNLTFCKPYSWPHSHQWWMKRLGDTYREKIADKLTNDGVQQWNYQDFDDLYDHLVKLNITSGKLFRYDLARRIGRCLNVLPGKSVYLHEGALRGAQILNKKGFINLPPNFDPIKDVRVDKAIFGGVFPGISSMDIENILCIYKKEF